MERFNLSAKAVNSLLDQLVAAKVLTQSELDGRRSLGPSFVVIDFDQATFPEITKEKHVISGLDAAQFIRSGIGDASLMKRYGISARGLRSLFTKLVASGMIQQSELDNRMLEAYDSAVIVE